MLTSFPQFLVANPSGSSVHLVDNYCCGATSTSSMTTTPSAPRFVVSNPSFEVDNLGAAQFVNRAAAWTITGNAGTWLPPTASFGQSNPLPSPFDGKQVLFIKSGASVSQTLGNSQLVPDSQFSLQVVVGWRQDSIPFPTSVTIELLAAPTLTVLATQTVTTASLDLSPGQSTTVTLSHSTNYGAHQRPGAAPPLHRHRPRQRPGCH